MKFVKSDWAIIREAEKEGLMVGMTGTVEPVRTELNNELSTYFRNQVPGYSGTFDEDEGEEILYSINEYMQENNINKGSIDFPFTSGTDVYLIPINENIQLKLLVADEYAGSGDYSKYVMADFFLINENATKRDVDGLVSFVQTVLK